MKYRIPDFASLIQALELHTAALGHEKCCLDQSRIRLVAVRTVVFGADSSSDSQKLAISAKRQFIQLLNYAKKSGERLG